MFFVLSGRPVFRNQHGEEEMAPGDFVFCPEGRAGLHAFSNPTEEPAQILAISAGSFPDVVAYPEDGYAWVATRDPDPELLARGGDPGIREEASGLEPATGSGDIHERWPKRLLSRLSSLSPAQQHARRD
jgi:uncharacterized cupin superfamily protein